MALTATLPAAVQTALDNFGATVDSISAVYGDAQDAPLAALIPAKIAGYNMGQALDAAVVAGDAALPTEVLTFATDGTLDPTSLTGAAQALCNQAALVIAAGYFERAVVNIENATG